LVWATCDEPRGARSGAVPSGAIPATPLTDDELVALLQRYLTILQGHPTAEAMMEEVLTPDFETGFIGGHMWRGLDGLRDFLSQRDGFFDERHVIDDLISRKDTDGEVEANTSLHFFLRRWESPSPTSDEFTGRCFHTWRVRRQGDKWRVAAQLVERFDDLNDNAERLFAAPEKGLNR
jgi:SnoaL-like domain